MPPVEWLGIILVLLRIGPGNRKEKMADKAILGGSVVKNLPTVQETQVPSLFEEDPLEKEMATHSSILAWRIPWRVEPGGLQSMGLPRVGHDSN